MLRRAGFLLVAIGCLLAAPFLQRIEADEPVSQAAAKDAMRRAVQFFRTQAASNGGYVFRWSEDLSLKEGEEKVGDSTIWIEPPSTPSVGDAYLNAFQLTQDPMLLEAAKETAVALLRGQLVSGGWDNLIEFDPQDRRGHAYRVDSTEIGKRRNITTFDDDKTQSVIRFLMHLDASLQQRDAEIHEAVLYALNGVLKSQYPNGAWPQRYDTLPVASEYPILKASYPEQWSRTFPGDKYTSHYTLNDGTISDLIATLLEAADIYGDSRYLDAAKRGGDFLLLAQMPDPQPGWCQQYDKQMHPAWARKFEPPAISGSESQAAMKTLLQLYRRTENESYRAAVEQGLDYYKRCLRPDNQLARFYELKTNRPLYMNRKYELTYTDDDVPTHYGFIVKSSLEKLETELQQITSLPKEQRWKPSQVKRPSQSSKLSAEAATVIAAMDSRGAWVEPGKMSTHEDSTVARVITSKTFIVNLDKLARFIAATN